MAILSALSAPSEKAKDIIDGFMNDGIEKNGFYVDRRTQI